MIHAITVLVTLASPPDLAARVAVAADLDTGEILYARDAERVHAIASISKLMAMQVVFKRGLKLDGTTVLAKSDYTQTKKGSRSRLVVGRTYKNIDLLHAALMGSDNRAVLALGRSVGLDFKALAAAMTAEARLMNMSNTTYVDPTGIDHANVSTGLELVQFLRAFMSLKELVKITGLPTFKTTTTDRWGHPLVYNNTNILTREDSWTVLTGKTGFNSAAGWSVVLGTQLRSGRRIAIVVLGTRDKFMRFRDARRIRRYVAKLPWEKPLPTPSAPPPSEASTQRD